MDDLISIVVPMYNEQESIQELIIEIGDVLSEYNLELIIIDDGSDDQSIDIVKEMIRTNNNSSHLIKLAELRRNTGQTAAMKAGFDLCNGTIVITMDADGQNDPSDIPGMITYLKENKLDVVCGWRKNRKDTFGKRIFSKFANYLRRKLTGLEIHDSGCTLRVYRKEAIKEINIWAEDHRYLPQIIYANGFSVGELEVNHRNRFAGKSKYGISRLYKGGLDLLSITFVSKLATKPLHFFTLIALPFLVIGSITVVYLGYVRLFYQESIGDRPLLLLGILFLIFGLQIFLSGLTNELITSIRMKDGTGYSIRSIIE